MYRQPTSNTPLVRATGGLKRRVRVYNVIQGIVMSFPLDTVKVRMQTTSGLYTGMIDCITKVAKQEGMKTFYRGVAAPVASYGIIKATTFGAPNSLRHPVCTGDTTVGSQQAHVPRPTQLRSVLSSIGRGRLAW
jgi:hypothetical protein